MPRTTTTTRSIATTKYAEPPKIFKLPALLILSIYSRSICVLIIGGMAISGIEVENTAKSGAMTCIAEFNSENCVAANFTDWCKEHLGCYDDNKVDEMDEHF